MGRQLLHRTLVGTWGSGCYMTLISIVQSAAQSHEVHGFDVCDTCAVHVINFTRRECLRLDTLT